MSKRRRHSPTKRELLAIIARLEKRIEDLENELVKARKNSSNSSKPPSSDILKPPKSAKPKDGKKGKRGGQPGHPKHDRPPFSPDKRPVNNMVARFEQHGEAYFEFITTPEIEPTNNLAEQAIRFVVIDRRITQGTRTAMVRTHLDRHGDLCHARSFRTPIPDRCGSGALPRPVGTLLTRRKPVNAYGIPLPSSFEV